MNSPKLTKAYLSVPIVDCAEPLVAIPEELFILEFPPPYIKLGADYGDASPYYLRQGVLNALAQACQNLAILRPDWQLKIFDAYRPVAVQQYMVDYTFQELLKQKVYPAEVIWQEVYKIWAIPSEDPKSPPPHSTGAAVDLTLVDSQGQDIDMGGQIDELSDRSQPDYYRNNSKEQKYQIRRDILLNIMTQAGFRRHPGEWWHFSLGDQMWTWQHNLENPSQTLIAKYGRINT
ncbi:MAG: M15 family metallopeptidase [Cyanobacteriota bacterium ELA615]